MYLLARLRAPIIFAIFVVPGIFCSSAAAQVSEAKLSGVVTDTSDAIVPNAEVSITNLSTNTSRELTSNQSGAYNAPGLPAGNYRLIVSAPGFKTEVRTGITLTTGQEQVVNVVLSLGTVTDQVIVTDVQPQVELSQATLSDVVDSTSVKELPLNGRSWTDLAALSIGVSVIRTQPPTSASDRPKRGLGAELSIAGDVHSKIAISWTASISTIIPTADREAFSGVTWASTPFRNSTSSPRTQWSHTGGQREE
jgi:hypothetical protein